MYAIVATGGKQYKVAVGDEIYVEKLEGEQGTEISLENVLAVFDGDSVKLGEEAKGICVKAEIVKQGRGKKIIVFKYKPKKGYRRKNGHRQPYTKLSIKSIA